MVSVVRLYHHVRDLAAHALLKYLILHEECMEAASIILHTLKLMVKNSGSLYHFFGGGGD